MAIIFKSHESYRRFQDSVRNSYRYVTDDDRDEFIRAVLETSVKRQETIKAGKALWRAQRGNDWIWVPYQDPEDPDNLYREPAAYKAERMFPLQDKAKEGRANPKGISHFYSATNEDTAIAEVRPWVSELVSVGQFQIERDLRVVNTVCGDMRIMAYGREPEPEERERSVWQDIDRAFSTPVTLSDDTADYVPTQVLAEHFKKFGLDGVAYGSSLGPGHNVVLFDVNVVRLHSCHLAEVTGVKYFVEHIVHGERG